MQKAGINLTLDELKEIANAQEAACSKKQKEKLQRRKAAKRAKKKNKPPPVRKLKRKQAAYAASDEFLQSYEWRQARYAALLNSDGLCCLCGRGKKHGVILNVDHIKPRRTHPELALSQSNLQVLCSSCNHGKGNWDSTDWR